MTCDHYSRLFTPFSEDAMVNVCFCLLDQDGAEPSPNSCSAGNLQRLHCYFPDKLVEPMASDIFKTFSKMLNDHPVAVPEMLSAFIFNSVSPKQVCTLLKCTCAAED